MIMISKRARSVGLAGMLLLVAAFVQVGTASAATPQFGFKDQSFSGASTAPSGSKPESKLWFNDGIWWATMWDTTTSQFHIFQLNAAGTTWSVTPTVIDSRASTRGDALWDGTHLYIASHDVASDSSHNTVNRPARLYRFSYSAATKSYSKDAGFPVTIMNYSTETMVIDKDSTGTIWATWTQAKKLTVAHTVGNDLAWSVPIVPAITGTGLNSDDVSSLIWFGGNRIGVMWSNQSSSHMYFTTHLDGDPDTTWSASEAVTSGSGSADDHINLKTDSAGRIYAAAKTSFTSNGATLIHLLVRGSGGGWSDYRFGTVQESNTRAIVEVDEQNGVVHMYATGPFPGTSSGQSGGTIFEKTAPIGAISFASGSGTPVIQDPGSADLNNASSTKQNINPASGIVVIATNDSTKFYWHSMETLGGASNTTPTANPVTRTTPFDTPATITLSGTDPETCQLTFAIVTGPTNGTLGATTNGACTPGSPNSDAASVTYTPTAGYTGSDSFTYTVNDGTATSAPATVSLTVSPNTTPTANPVTRTTPFDTPATITLSGTDPETCQLTFAIVTGPTNGTLGATTNGACTPGSPNSDAASVTYTPTAGYTGSDSFTYTVNDGTATSAPAMVSLTVSPANPTTLTLTPIADSYVSSSNLTGNYGTLTTMKVREGDGSSTNPNYRTYLKFDVSGVTGTVSAVTLRIYVTDASANLESVYVVGDSSWTETAITYTNAPPISGNAVGTTQAAPVGAYVTITLAPTTVSSSTATLTLALKSSATDSLIVSSREDPTNKPQLIVTFQ